jgi:hypothetical protein
MGDQKGRAAKGNVSLLQLLATPQKGESNAAVYPHDAAALTLLIRTGRTSEYKRELLRRLWKLFQNCRLALGESCSMSRMLRFDANRIPVFE